MAKQCDLVAVWLIANEKMELSILSPELRLSAYWALSKRFDKNLLPFFRNQLEVEIEVEGAPAVFQLLIAIDNLAEPVFGTDRNGSFSGFDSDLNIRDAKAYLKGKKEKKGTEGF